MTNTESRIGVDLEELAWDDADALEKHGERLRDAGMCELPAYAFDSESRTLVGLGPVERARRSRGAAEIPNSERMPQSEPPGPFIADDDEELSRALRGRPLGPWPVVVPAALLMVAAAVAVVRGLTTSRAPRAGKAVVAAVAPPTIVPAAPATVSVAQTSETTSDSEPSVSLGRVSGEAAEDAPAEDAPAEANGGSERGPIEAVPVRSEVAPRGAGVKAPSAPPLLPVKLPELPPPTIIDMSDSADSSVGTINVTSRPPSNVVLDGRPLGQAPRLVQVPAGRHTVVFIHPLYGRQSRRVNVGAGQTASASADF